MLAGGVATGGYVRRLWLIPIVLALAVGYALLDSRSGFREAHRLRSDLHAANGRIAQLQSRNEALRDQVASRRDDPFAQERAIREELGLARPDETVVRFPREGRETPRIP